MTMTMTNFLKETASVMIAHGLDVKDIVYIGNGECSCTWDEFQVLANTNYGYGSGEIDGSLIIVFSNGVEMHRGEYDGSEWWDVHTPFKLENLKEQKKLTGVKSGW